MKISVVIPAWNEEKYIGRILSDLDQQVRRVEEVIVVDGQSEDRTVEVVTEQYPKVRVVIADQRGVGYQRSLGGKVASGDLLIFLDADVAVEVDFVQRLSEQIQQRGLDLAAVKYVPRTNAWGVKFFYWFFNSLFFVFQKTHPSGGGSCLVVRKKLFEQLGGFTSEHVYDDIDLVRRGARLGKFGIVDVAVFVSDRRFRKYGLWSMWKKYLILSWYFAWNDFDGASRVKYEFGKF
jgi:glycosyltransferase involved in cell wall biosynthesis